MFICIILFFRIIFLAHRNLKFLPLFGMKLIPVLCFKNVVFFRNVYSLYSYFRNNISFVSHSNFINFYIVKSNTKHRCSSLTETSRLVVCIIFEKYFIPVNHCSIIGIFSLDFYFINSSSGKFRAWFKDFFDDSDFMVADQKLGIS